MPLLPLLMPCTIEGTSYDIKYAYVYIYIYVHIYIYIYKYIYVHIYTCICIWLSESQEAEICVLSSCCPAYDQCVSVRVHANVRVYVSVNRRSLPRPSKVGKVMAQNL